ncbi:biotin--[acetyl-CoA-carboxylase] ligase [Cyanobium sp. WAJ14-Wanaka]|uniref:biotin--[acetyl-CoA-carboxylase] ligase n=1 Tax=Cyanobium sp. WAJ14-Wanaka TaxID=2823725 RepID=UPI0020CDBF1D|nr:biotin--[acetyl-CoA-carboxylase] ligase [Cyanobium sp. WAJ14-Wanaka]MCP9774129.1 biotin--[acetyl-CoA-carboxylase] ligase [Cyanobium sp. WAJ14-Wanaka]
MVGEALSPQGWQIRRLAVCASTERELARWLAQRDGAGLALDLPLAPASGLKGLAVVSRRQRHGQGQQGRLWHSPPGGLWLSAAVPWPEASASASGLALAVAVSLAEPLLELGVAVQLKWPNDLLVAGCKLAGILPRLRWRGSQLRWAQVGVGINGVNRVPPGAISLAQALGARRVHPKACPGRLLAPVLEAIARAPGLCLSPELLLDRAEALLLRPSGGLWHGGNLWQVVGLESSGGLILERSGIRTTLQQRFAQELPAQGEPSAARRADF